MLSNYRNVNAAKTAPILSGHHNKNSENAQQQPSTKSHHNNKEHGKNQPILPEVGQYVYDTKTGKKYMRGKLMGKVRPLYLLQTALFYPYLLLTTLSCFAQSFFLDYLAKLPMKF